MPGRTSDKLARLEGDARALAARYEDLYKSAYSRKEPEAVCESIHNIRILLGSIDPELT